MLSSLSSKLYRKANASNGDEKIVIEWKDINYSVLEKDGKKSSLFRTVMKNKQILNNLHGKAESGQLLAIMGPTGCGKTSLLNALASRVSTGGKDNVSFTGQILDNGLPRKEEDFRRISAYVLQDDKLYPHLTVKETFLLAAHFFLPESYTLEMKMEKVDSVISELGLVKAKDTCIGDERVRGVSGGERKRANIGVQLISNPVVLFLDEPTSGLDSFQSQAVMESMKNLAQNGRLVISVIHQPRSSIFEMFDRLLLLSEGRTMYFGPSKDAANYFESIDFHCPKLFNPSDYFLDILSPDYRTLDAEVETKQRIEMIAEKWQKYEEEMIIKKNMRHEHGKDLEGGEVDESADGVRDESHSLKVSELQPLPLSTLPTMTVERFFRNLGLLGWRALTEQTREITTLVIRLCVTCFFGLLIAGVYNNLGYDQSSIHDRQGFLFIIAINQGFGGCLGVLNSFPKEKVIVNRERAAYAYDTLSYFFSKWVVELPINVLPCIVFGCIVYYIAGLNPDTFGYFLLILMFEALTAVSLGLAISAITPTIDAAQALGPPLVIIALLFGGFYINVNSLPIVANWIPYLSFLKWTFEALCINEFKGETFNCEGGAPGACISTGEQVLTLLSFNGDTIYDACFGLGMVLLGFTVSAIFFLMVSKLTFLPIGFVSSKQKSFQSRNSSCLIANPSTPVSPSKSLKTVSDSNVQSPSTSPDVPDVPPITAPSNSIPTRDTQNQEEEKKDSEPSS